MRINYYPDTDSLYIDLSAKTSVDSREVSDGVVLDYDVDGNLVGIDIDQASVKLDINELILSKLPADVTQVASLESAGSCLSDAKPSLRSQPGSGVLSAHQSGMNVPPTAAELEVEPLCAQEKLRQPEEELARDKDELRQLDGEIMRNKEELLRRTEDLLQIRRQKDALNEHLLRAEQQLYRKQHKELSNKV